MYEYMFVGFVIVGIVTIAVAKFLGFSKARKVDPE